MSNSPDPASTRPLLTRRALLAGAGAAGIAAIAPRGRVTLASLGIQATPTLPDDAAPPERQVFIAPNNPLTPKVLDFFESAYERPVDSATDLFSDPLVRVDKNFNIVPAAATSYSSNDAGTVWTFQLDPNLVWSDGNPVTAADWVKTFHYEADPKHAWDFAWFWSIVIKNFADAVAGKVGLDEIGVKQGANEHELVIETLNPAPYLPSMLVYSGPLSAAAFDTYGPLYNTDPKTCVSSGPFILQDWARDQQIVYVKNDTYKGTLQVPVTKVIVKLAPQNTHFTLFQSDEVDFMYRPAPAELKLAQQEMPDQLYSSVGDFRTFYLFFDVTKKPFDDLRVRQAFGHCIDRDAIESQILGPQGTPAYSFLPPGFPAANGDALKGIQNFDPDKAKQLMSEAGYPDGKDFPKLTLWLRNEIPLNQDVANACVSMLTETLGVNIEVANKDLKTFTDALSADPTEITFGFVSYGLDFLDPFNLLGVWLSSGVYSWTNSEYDKDVMAAASFLGPKEERIKMFQEAERLLVSEAPAIFIYHETPVQLIKPWVKGAFIEPDDNGITAMHWPGYTAMGTVPGELLITNDVPSDRR